MGVHGGARTAARWRGLARRAAAVGGVCVALGTLGACTGDGGASPSPSGSEDASTTTTSPSPSRSAAPERPAAMDRDDVVGAKAAAQYFLELYPYVYNTGDLTAWKAMSDPECIFCASVVTNVETLHAAGGYETGGEMTIENVVGADPVEGNPYFAVDVWFTQSPGVEFDANGAQTDTFDGGAQIAYYAISQVTGQWIVRGITVERQS